MTDMQNYEAVAVKLAGVAGAMVSMKFINGIWPERLSLGASGAVLAYFASPWVSEQLSMPEGLTGFLVGFFGMAIASKAWETVQAFPMAAVCWLIVAGWPGRICALHPRHDDGARGALCRRGDLDRRCL